MNNNAWVIPVENPHNNNLEQKNNNKLKCFISIIGDGKIKNICLNEFNKNKITFGRLEDNDIVLSSCLVSAHHGYFTINNGTINIFDSGSKNSFYINNNKCVNGIVIKDGDSIKIDNPDNPLSVGIMMLVTISEKIDKWHECILNENKISIIGRNPDCDIVLDRVSISMKHAKIEYDKNGYYISSFDGKSDILINNSILHGKVLLRNKDIILINNIMLIFNENKIIYRKHDIGIRLDAIDIVKTVKLKGKKRDISQHIDFSANPGEFIALVGGSGAGKSTFLKCICGVVKPTSGQVLINGNDLFSNYDILKKMIGYVPQDNIVFDDLTLIQMLKYAANLRMPDDTTTKEKENRIKEVLEILELSNKENVMIRNLSGGQQKRACIAVELIADPKIFFLDEPTSGLDPGTERSLMKTLRKMADRGKTIILVTHNTLNLHLCDKVVFFGYGGKMCFNGAPQDALKFFKVDDFVDVYNLLNNNTDEWNNNYNESVYKQKIEVEKVNSSVSNKVKAKSFIKQVITLFSRKMKTLFHNKAQLLLLFGQAPLISTLLSFVTTEDLFYAYEETKAILFTISTAAIWIGILNSIQEICKERVILKKEFMADLRIDAYLTSKILYLLFLSIIQSILFMSTFTLIIDVPTTGLFTSWYLESVLVLFFTIFSASTMGLFVSTISKNTSTSLTIPTILLVPQMLFAGMLFPLNGIIAKISNFILCRWSMEALGTINDLNSLVSAVQEAVPGYVREIENFYTFTVEHLTYDLSIIVLITSILVGACYCVLKTQLERVN